MADMRETYTLMFTDYPDIVNLNQMRKMLGGISNTLAYRMLREKTIKSKKDLKEKLQKGIDDINANRVYSIEEVFNKIDNI